MAVHAYIRAGATDEAALLFQRQIDVFCQQRDLLLHNLIIDRRSSAETPLADRQWGRQLLGLLEAGCAVIAVRREQLFCDANDAIATCARWRDAKVSLHLVELDAQVVDAFAALASLGTARARTVALAKLEAELIAQRDRRRHGVYSGGREPFGQRRQTVVENDGRTVQYLVEDPAETAALDLIHELHAGGWSSRRIVGELEQRLGVNVSHELVCRLVNQRPLPPARPRYFGPAPSVKEAIRQAAAKGKSPGEIVAELRDGGCAPRAAKPGTRNHTESLVRHVMDLEPAHDLEA